MHPDILGWTAAALMVATFSCREARHLRPLAVATNLAFVGYGAAAGLMPVLALHLLLLPINLWRWAQAVALSRRDVRQAAEQFGRLLCVVALSAVPLVTGCGGGGGDEGSGATPPSPQPSGNTPATIGPAGGTVRHASGAEVVVPAGALAAPAAVEIAATSAGAPTWPSDVTAFGEVYAFTPHGTRFAVPVSVSVPFDPTRVPAGQIPVLYKTDATGTRWEPVADAVVDGATVRGSVTGFSYFVVARPALELTGIYRLWSFNSRYADFSTRLWGEPGVSEWGETRDVRFYRRPSPPPGVAAMPDGEVFSTSTGATYGARATTPISDFGLDPQGRVGMTSDLTQVQYFRKRDETATLRFTISKVRLAATDFDPRPLVCRFRFDCDNLDATANMDVRLIDQVTGEVYFARGGWASIGGIWGDWSHHVNSGGAAAPLWAQDQFELRLESNGTGAVLELKSPIPVDVPLGRVPVGARLALYARVWMAAWDLRRSESGATAFLRDPQELGGMTVEHTGLEVSAPVAVELPGPHRPRPEPACASEPFAEAGQLQLAQAAQETGERPMHAGQWVTVTRTGGSRGRVSVRLSTQDGGTARAGADYEVLDTHIVWEDGEEGDRSVLLAVVPDEEVEPTENLQVALSDVGGCATLGALQTATLTIHDNDGIVAPPPSYRVGGTVTGLEGPGLVLEDRAQSIDLAVSFNGNFQLAQPYSAGAAYDVRVKAAPTNPVQVCTVTRGSGNVAAADIVDIAVNCVTPPPPTGLDTTFGTLGKVAQGLPGGAIAIGRQSTGHIVAVNGTRLVRYDADGKLDRTFGGGRGIVDSLLVGAGAEVSGMSIGPDDRIVVAGRILQPGLAPPNYQMAAARFMPDGTRDTNFGSSGQATFRLAGIAESAARVLVQPDGRVLLLGQMTLGSGLAANNNIALVRLLTDGGFDGSFGASGAVMFDATKRDFPQAALLQPDGRVVIGGKVAVNDSEPSDSFYGRVDALGAPEAGFGRTPPYSTISDEVVDMALQPDGRIVLLVAARGVNWEIALARINADGSPDTSFGTQGLVRRDVGPHDDWPRAVAVQADGRIVVAAQVSNPLPMAPSFALLRFEAGGAPDLGFGTDGVLRVPFFGGTDNANDLFLQPDGRIVAAGSARSGLTADIAMVRLIP